VSVNDRLGRRVDLATAVDLGRRVPRAGGVDVTSVAVREGLELNLGALLDPAVWESTVALPDTGGRKARVVVREYERYYTDRTVPEVGAGATRRRRVVEERLVYTAFFDL
jgi:hypothetical protein